MEKFIELNNHLPGAPSAKRVEEEGIAMGDMAKLMMEKIEELTLHVIEQAKKVDEQSEQIKKLQEENLELRKENKLKE